MTTNALTRRRRPRGRYPKRVDGDPQKRARPIPEYLEADEVNAIIRAAPNPKAKMLMLEQWRAGLRVSEALDLEVRDLSLGAGRSEACRGTGRDCAGEARWDSHIAPLPGIS